ncbi:hypothetical protein G6F56_008172 [Rhizopus delemar]|nr:hypothetical protein G6F56_008172 [Rhizopus delemar]
MSSRRILNKTILEFQKAIPRQRLVLSKSAPNKTFLISTWIKRREYSTDQGFKIATFDDIQQLIKSNNKDHVILDVREYGEVEEGYIPTAKNVPLTQFAYAWELSEKDFEATYGFDKPKQDVKIIPYCLKGVRSAMAAAHLSAIGYTNQRRAERMRSLAIDRAIKADNTRLNKEFKVLLLGSGESGKSTIFKQMKILFHGGYTPDELIKWKAIVYSNLVQSAQAFVQALFELGYPLSSEKSQYDAQLILNYRLQDNLDPVIADAITSVWKDPGTRSLMRERSNEFYLMDSAPYFFNGINRLRRRNYVPNIQDVLHARAKTTGINETRFTIGETIIHMFDVGGQRSERRKWIHCFEAVKLAVFCISLSEYDQVLLEESRQNRMLESLVLYDSVGGVDRSKALKYILWRFHQANRTNAVVYPHLAQATDTKNGSFKYEGNRAAASTLTFN